MINKHKFMFEDILIDIQDTLNFYLKLNTNLINLINIFLKNT